ncbi:GSU2403 family nucleotidyltransferase fold protein [Methyloraptor flagellatus]|uniref:nucleotidyltransferase family protein n=1 Tax=Methyloraptor flagellatus TaxID=3162530 RepID=UPI00387DD52A
MRLLRAEGCLTPDLANGQILAAMARVGVFRLGGTVVGTQAFRHYDGVLGICFSADQAAQTQDVDVASFERLSVALQDRVEERLADVFGALKFEPVPSADPGRAWRWRQTEQETLVEFLTPSFDESEGLKELPALGVAAQSLHFLNYLIARPIKVPLLYRSGVLIQVPRAERYAIHKLIVADRRLHGPEAAKARKDRAQSAFLIRFLAEEQPDLIADAYATALGNGPSWRAAIARSLARMPETKMPLDALPA